MSGIAIRIAVLAGIVSLPAILLTTLPITEASIAPAWLHSAGNQFQLDRPGNLSKLAFGSLCYDTGYNPPRAEAC
jgi:hypothetical protein